MGRERASRNKQYEDIMREFLPRVGETIRVNVPTCDAYTDLEYVLVQPKRRDLIPHMIEQEIECQVDDAIRAHVWNTFVAGPDIQKTVLLAAIRSYLKIGLDVGDLSRDLSEIEPTPFIPSFPPSTSVLDSTVQRHCLSNVDWVDSLKIETCRADVQEITNDVSGFLETVAVTASAILYIEFCGRDSEMRTEVVVESTMGVVIVQVTDKKTFSNLDLSAGRSPSVPHHADDDAKTRAVRRYGLIKALISGAIYKYHVSETSIVVKALCDLLRITFRGDGSENSVAEEIRKEEVRGFLDHISSFCVAMNNIAEMALKTCHMPTSNDSLGRWKQTEHGAEVRESVQGLLRHRGPFAVVKVIGKRFPLRNCYVSRDVSAEVSLVVLQAVKKKLRRLHLCLYNGERKPELGSFLQIYVKRQLLDEILTEADRDRLVGRRRHLTYQDTGKELAICLPSRGVMLVYPKDAEREHWHEPKQIASPKKSREAILTMMMLPKFLECGEHDKLFSTICDEARLVQNFIANRSQPLDASFLRVLSEKGIHITRVCDKIYHETRERTHLDREWMIREVLSYAASLGVGPTVETERHAGYIDAVMAMKNVNIVSRSIVCDRPVNLDGTICYELEFDDQGNSLPSVSTARTVMLAEEGNLYSIEVEGYEAPNGTAVGHQIGRLKVIRSTGRLRQHFHHFLAQGISVS